jgi:hypothetical protein
MVRGHHSRRYVHRGRDGDIGCQSAAGTDRIADGFRVADTGIDDAAVGLGVDKLWVTKTSCGTLVESRI